LSDENNRKDSSAPQVEDYISKRALKSFFAFSAKMRGIRAKAYEASVDELLFHIIEELDLIDHFDTISKTKAEFDDRKGNVQELRQAAKKYATVGNALSKAPVSEGSFDGESALTNFLDDVALVSDIADAEEKKEKNDDRLVVNLLTIHASKGTEFDGVFVVGMEEGTLPCTPALQDDASPVQLEEERRLCYVAMTRAKTHLILSWRKEVTVFGDWSSSGPKTFEKKRSRFLEALVAKTKMKSEGEKGLERTDVPSMKSKPRSSPQRRVLRHGLTSPTHPGRNYSSAPASVARRHMKDAATRNKDEVVLNLKRANNVSRIPNAEHPVIAKRSTLNTGAKHTTVISKSEPKPESRSGSSPPSFLDPTWFFPVGESVLHRNLGPGVVLGHSHADQPDETKVQVKFENGKVLEFPALGSDIVPDLGR
jgi:hypothetical protein